MTRALVLAPTPAMRAGLRALLEEGGIEVVGEVATVAATDGAPVAADVLVVAGEVGVGAAVRAAAGAGGQAVVAVADSDGPVATLRARPLRGWGVVSPDAPAAELVAAVAAAAQGLVVLPAGLASRLPLPRAGPATVEPLPEPLTPREHEVLELLGQGLTNRRIGERLGITEHTAKFHVASVLGKLGAGSRADAVTRALRRGLITL